MTEHYTESQGSGNYWRTVMVTGDQANQSKKDTVRALDVGYEIHRAFTVEISANILGGIFAVATA